MCVRTCSVLQASRAFRASLDDEGLISVTLERSDLRANVTAYAAQLTGEPRAALVTFANASGGHVTFRASLHGAIYSVGLLLQQEGEQGWSPPVHTIALLTSKSNLLLYLHSISVILCLSHFLCLTKYVRLCHSITFPVFVSHSVLSLFRFSMCSLSHPLLLFLWL